MHAVMLNRDFDYILFRHQRHNPLPGVIYTPDVQSSALQRMRNHVHVTNDELRHFQTVFTVYLTCDPVARFLLRQLAFQPRPKRSLGTEVNVPIV